MHWSKSRHIKFEHCARQFFYEVVAAPLNSRIAALKDGTSPHLARHDAVRAAILRIASSPTWSNAQLPGLFAEARAQLRRVIGTDADTNAQMSIVKTCLDTFVGHVLPAIRAGRVLYVNHGEPVEFMYDGLTMMVLPEVVVEHADRLVIYQFKTGSAGFANTKDRDQRLRAGGLTCWARCSLSEVTKPVHVIDLYLRSVPPLPRRVVMDDEAVRQFVAEARGIVPRYSTSMKVADFPANPNFSKCKFCDYKRICPEHVATTETNYELDTLMTSLETAPRAHDAALTQTGGEVRQVFLSHVTADKDEMVRPFARALEVEGVSYWIDEAELQWGDSLATGINQGLATSDYVVTFITDAFLQRGWTRAELNSSLVAHVNGKKRLMPIFHAPIDAISAEYPMLAGIVGKKWSEGVPSLVKALLTVLRSTRMARAQ